MSRAYDWAAAACAVMGAVLLLGAFALAAPLLLGGSGLLVCAYVLFARAELAGRGE